MLREYPVSRETLARLEKYVALLIEWNGRHNLVSAMSLRDVWRRHILDSIQLSRYVPRDAESLVDLGSGAGFPGLVLAAETGLAVTLIEATRKKCAFLEEAAAVLGVKADICDKRIEDVLPQVFDVIVARACAPLPRLLAYAQRFCGPVSVCLFLKGQNVGSELTQARNCWSIELQSFRSLSDPAGTVLEIRELHERDAR